MRRFVVGSLVVHGVAFAAVVRLQPHARDAAPKIIALELIAPTVPTPIAPPQPSAASSAKAQRNRTAVPPRLPSPPSTTTEPPTPTPPQTPPPSLTPEPTASPGGVLSPRRTGIDLTWHGTPSAVPPSDAASSGVATVGPRPEWRPKGTAGDPILGKVDEVPDDPYPLVKKKDGWVYKGAGFAAKIHKDGSVTFDDKVIGFDKGVFSFDLTDAIMRAKKQDPYRREKEKFLAHTRALREKLLDQARAFREGVIAPTELR